jgi:hypothetical protein
MARARTMPTRPYSLRNRTTQAREIATARTKSEIPKRMRRRGRSVRLSSRRCDRRATRCRRAARLAGRRVPGTVPFNNGPLGATDPSFGNVSGDATDEGDVYGRDDGDVREGKRKRKVMRRSSASSESNLGMKTKERPRTRTRTKIATKTDIDTTGTPRTRIKSQSRYYPSIPPLRSYLILHWQISSPSEGRLAPFLGSRPRPQRRNRGHALRSCRRPPLARRTP